MLSALLGARGAVDATMRALAGGQRRFGLVGAEGSGKSAALAAIAEQLAARNEPVHRFALTHGDDAAFVAMVSLAGQLDPGDAGILRTMRDGAVPFSRKLNELSDRLEEKKGTLLIDDPPSLKSESEGTVFDDRAAELGDRLQRLREVRLVVATRRHFSGPSVIVQARFEAGSVLDAFEGGPFSDAAAELRRGASLDHYSPVEVRLAVAAVARRGRPSELTNRRWDPSDLLDVVLDGEAQLRSLVGALALVRVPFDDDLLRELGGPPLSERCRNLLDEVLLLQTPEGRVLHGLIARRARGDDWLPEEEHIKTHGALARWHRARFEERKASHDLPGAFSHEVEVVHHLTEAGDFEAVLKAEVYFPEQYDALGKALSLQKRHPDAVRAYERAITYEAPDRVDAYAHHYLAYNLDILAEDEARVRDEYIIARDAQPTHPWFWNRFICFRITTGHLEDAMNLWAEAAARFQLDRDEEWIATVLHRNVAHLLTHRGQIESARRVLRDVPVRARSTDWFVALAGWLSELEAAERDELVFPPHLEPAKRWDGPHLLLSAADRDRVLAWSPGRVASSDTDGIRVLVAKGTAPTVTFGYRDIAHEELVGLTTYPRYGLRLPAGTFIEILTMRGDGGASIEQLLSWPPQDRRLAGLPPIFPPPNRYIRRAFARR